MMADTCVCCGAPVPEGRQVCWVCEHGDEITQPERLPRKQNRKEAKKKMRHTRRSIRNVLAAKLICLTVGIMVTALAVTFICIVSAAASDDDGSSGITQMSATLPIDEVPKELSFIVEVDIEPEEEHDYTEQDVTLVAKTVYGEAQGCTTTEQAAVVWCILNRVDSDDPYYPDSISGVVTQANQFVGYSENNPVTDEIHDLVIDVLDRWEAEKAGEEDAGRVLPSDYLYFSGDGVHNYFRNEYRGGQVWDWSLESPYEN